jgi:hypothetical protein
MDGMNAKKNVFIIGATSKSTSQMVSALLMLQTDRIRSIALFFDLGVSIRYVLEPLSLSC